LCWAIDNILTRKVSASDALFIAGIKGLPTMSLMTSRLLPFLMLDTSSNARPDRADHQLECAHVKVASGGRVVNNAVSGGTSVAIYRNNTPSKP